MGSKLERKGFFERHGLTQAEFESTGLEWSTLELIYEQHYPLQADLLKSGQLISSMLQSVPSVHSLKVRVKDPEKLCAKVIRKKLKNPEWVCSADSYEKGITDLTGVRALHLFKDEWLELHKFILDTWQTCETPTAYVRSGDPEADFKEAGCEVRVHPYGYRSVHYLIESHPGKKKRIVELQTRTIFEEGWSEIDHRVRYPRQSNNPSLVDFLMLFNRTAGSADEMGTFTRSLGAQLLQQEEQAQRAADEIAAKEKELRKIISKLKISQEQQRELQTTVDALSKSNAVKQTLEWPATVLWPEVVSGKINVPPPISISWENLKICQTCGRSYKEPMVIFKLIA